MPTVVGDRPLGLVDVTALRLVRDAPGDADWRGGEITVAERDYASRAQAEARAGRSAVTRGLLAFIAAAPDTRTAFVSFYIDGQFVGVSNAAPYTFNWNTRSVPDGEYVIEAVAEDSSSQILPASPTRMKIWVDNGRKMARD